MASGSIRNIVYNDWLNNGGTVSWTTANTNCTSTSTLNADELNVAYKTWGEKKMMDSWYEKYREGRYYRPLPVEFIKESEYRPINHSVPRNQLGYYKSLLDYYRLLKGDRPDYDIQGMEIGAAIDLLKNQK